jgi:hypothetical protein
MNEIVIARSGVHLVVEYHAGAVAEPDIAALVTRLNALLDAGSRFGEGEMLQLGWSTLRFVSLGGGVLAFEELDGSGVARWTRGVSRTLIATRLQRSVNESFGLSDERLAFPNLAQRSLICTALDPDGALFLHRLEPISPSDSGWFFSCQGTDHDHDDPAALEHASLYEHACRIQAVLPFLALPIGTRVLLGPDGNVDEAYEGGGHALAVVPGSYLAERRGRTSRV